MKNGLAVNLAKSKFHKNEVMFLGNIVNGSEIHMDPPKLDTIAKWPRPTENNEVQAFLGFANYSHRFISTYSEKARPLTQLTRDVPFTWGTAQQDAFNELRNEFIQASILT